MNHERRGHRDRNEARISLLHRGARNDPADSEATLPRRNRALRRRVGCRRELFKKAANLGLFGIRIDPEWGGLGLDWWASAAYMEAMAYSDSGSVNMALMVQSEITLPALAELGTREQKEEFLRPAVAGDMIASLGISEPSGGSDVAALKTRARLDGGDL